MQPNLEDRFSKKRPFRHVIPFPDGVVDYSGPPVSQWAWCHALKDTDWFETRPSTLEQCIADDVIPCVVGGPDFLKRCEAAEWPVSFLPNTVFYDSGARWKNFNFFQSPWTYSVLMLNDEDLNAAWQLTNSSFRGAISRVRHFLRPSIYQSDFYDGRKLWDVLLYFKSRDFNMSHISARWPNFTSLQNGYYTYEELRYKAQRSRFCIIGSCWDSYGVAAQEIMAEGCPALVCDPGSLPGNSWIGRQSLNLENRPNPTIMGSDPVELDRAVEEILSWRREDVREATLRFADPQILREQWRQALYGDLPEQRTRATPNPMAFCFAKGRYVPRAEAKCVQADLEFLARQEPSAP